ASLLAFVDGEKALLMPSAQDHKAAYDGDRGPNTGGMGAYSPAPVVTPEICALVEERILSPTIQAMQAAGREYRGVLYAGLMVTADGPKVIEFNCRFGDPEAQAILPRLKSDLVPALLATIDGGLEDVRLEWDPRACVCVVLASQGYPLDYETGFPIEGLEEAEKLPDVLIFHAGTRQVEDRVVTDGGRVLGVTALGETIRDAISRAYQAVDRIHFEGKQYRKDIGFKALARL
ncbi:MAG TPA: phosphoribosylamine--glycine ligase, partial [Limnochordia bacterium]|nr:phosphoribosylamine--glycine ligase [Limnochordia bacterium]